MDWNLSPIRGLDKLAWKIEVYDNFTDQADLVQGIRDLGIDEIESVDYTRLYFLEGGSPIKSETSFSSSQIDLICSELLADNITQSYRFQPENLEESNPGYSVEVRFKPGVTDSVGESVGKGIQDLEIAQGSSNSNLADEPPPCGTMEGKSGPCTCPVALRAGVPPR